jgi:hypothetical protein
MNDVNIIVKFSQKDHNFIIYERDKLLGVFGIPHIIKYITSKISKDLLKTIEYESSVEIIEKLFCKFDSNDNLVLIGYLDSPLTGNIEIMMKIYSEINKFDQIVLQNYIESLESQDIKTKIIKAIRNFEYLILNHSLKLIVNISDAIKNNNSKSELKMTLIKYSIFIINKINYIICDNINDTKTDILLLNVELDQMKNIRSNIENKVKKIENTVNEQNFQIKKIINYIDADADDILNLDNLDIDENDNDSDKNSDSNNNLELEQNGVEFNDSDYSYTEESNKKTNIDYLTPNNI